MASSLTLPAVGLGVYRAAPEECYESVLKALKLGYRHIDTAAFYQNEADVGRAVRDSGIPRSEIWVTTKLWIDDIQGPGTTTAAFQKSLRLLDIGYIDLYLIHAPADGGRRLEAWKEMEAIAKQGLTRHIGVSNYGIKHLEELLAVATIKPLANQIELHPFLQHRDLVAFCQKNGITVQAYSPLTKARKLNDPVVVEVAQKVNKTPAQVLIKWGLQKGAVSLPKSVQEGRLKENFEVFEWTIPESEIAKLDSLEEGLVTGWDPTIWE
ncbi:NADP-dependent oxidoreductase domain-containing protein [Obelidium mucronatum]|nr:NADP-dependent oxidoreductase domain-containing protein [Obelidium mucronatum]